jgi:hypothetical protein
MPSTEKSARTTHGDELIFANSTVPSRTSLPCYPANVAAACQAASTVVSGGKSRKKGAWDLEKRRKTNCRSAKAWRNRKKHKFADLHDQVIALRREHRRLEFENAKLQKVLAIEVELAKSDTALLAIKSLQDRHRKQSVLNHLTSHLTWKISPHLVCTQGSLLPCFPKSSLIAETGGQSNEATIFYPTPRSHCLTRRGVNDSLEESELVAVLRGAAVPSLSCLF